MRINTAVLALLHQQDINVDAIQDLNSQAAQA